MIFNPGTRLWSLLGRGKRILLRSFRIWRYGEDLRFGSYESDNPELSAMSRPSRRLRRLFHGIRIVLRTAAAFHAASVKQNRAFLSDPLRVPFSGKYGKFSSRGVSKNAFCLIENVEGSMSLSLPTDADGIFFFISVVPTSPRMGMLEIFLGTGEETEPILAKKIDAFGEGWSLYYHPLSAAKKQNGEPLMFRWKTTGSKADLALSVPVIRRRKKTRRVIVLIADAVRPKDVGLYSGKTMTPNIDRYFANGLVCTNSYSQSNWTLPTFASMAQSRYASSHGVVDPDQFLIPLARKIPTLAELLRSHGFFTFGSVSHQRVSPSLGHHRGFEHFRYIPTVEAEEGTIGNQGENDMIRQIRELCDYLRHLKGTDFFGFVHIFDTHFPYFDNPHHLNDRFLLFPSTIRDYVKKSFRENLGSDEKEFLISRYASKVSELDYHLEELFRLLGGMENTTVVFTSDHGYSFDRHITNTLDDEEIRTPFLLRSTEFPIPQGRSNRHVESSIDLLPTITSLYGINDPAKRSGLSLVDPEGRLFIKNHAVSELVYREKYRLKIVGDGGRMTLFGTTRERSSGRIALNQLKIMKQARGNLSPADCAQQIACDLQSTDLKEEIKSAALHLLQSFSADREDEQRRAVSN